MRNGQNKRMRGRNRGKSHNPLTRVYESNGPDIKIRGTASHVAEKYVQLARDAQASGDPVAAENFYRHESSGNDTHSSSDIQDEGYEEVEDESAGQPMQAGEQPQFGIRDPQPYLPRDAQFFSPRDQQYAGRPQQQGERHSRGSDDANVDRLPSFITGGQPQPSPTPGNQGPQAHGQNGFDNQGDRFPMHRRRRRHRGGPRGDAPRGMQEGADDTQGPHGE